MSEQATAPAGLPSDGRVLVLGASGYIGRHLVPHLRDRGVPVRAAGRRLSALQAERWENVELVQADALDPDSLARALKGVSVAYYLVHSMAAGADFPEQDRRAARVFAQAAAEAGVQRIVYLGGLSPANPDTPHLASRVETGEILRQGRVPVIEVRAGIIIGPGSAAFEVMRDLVAHLPVMVTPRWVRRKSPPIALDDILAYLAQLPWIPAAADGIYEAGGPENLTYEEMMRMLAREMGKREPFVIPVPVLTPQLSSYWLAFVSATPVRIARALITGLKYDLSADDRSLRALLPPARIDFREAIRRVFRDEQEIHAVDRWREGAWELRGRRHDISFYAKTLTRTAETDAPPAAVWDVLGDMGTRGTGYFYLNPVWRIRKSLDAMLGGRPAGPSTRRGAPYAGERFDIWRVLAAVPERRLTLLSSLVAPGTGGMEVEIAERADGGSRVSATIYWHVVGFRGLLYWYALGPGHAFMLAGMTRAIARQAAARAASAGQGARA